MADLADHAYAHAVALLGPGDAACDVAVAAVHRGGRSRSAVLGHARAAVLASADAVAPADLDAIATDDLTELALVLAATRPPLERVVVDLDTRHGLDRGGLGRALGQPAASAESQASEIALAWQQSLDPVLLARLGPGGCDGLAAALATTPIDPPDGEAPDEVPPTPSVRDLVALGPAVADHAAGCDACRDRLRSMVSVRTLVGQRPLETAPAAVRSAAAPSRLRRPTPAPPLETVHGTRRWVRPAALVAGALALALVGGVVVATVGSSDDEAPVEALTRVPDAGSAADRRPACGHRPRPDDRPAHEPVDRRGVVGRGGRCRLAPRRAGRGPAAGGRDHGPPPGGGPRCPRG